MAQPVFEPLEPLFPEHRPKALITVAGIPDRSTADNYVRMAIRDYDGIDGKIVVLRCIELRWWTQDFTEQLVRRLFEQGAWEIWLVEAHIEFWTMVRGVAARMGLTYRVLFKDTTALRGLVRQYSEAPPPSHT